MTIKALGILIDAGLLTSSGRVVNLNKLSQSEITSRISRYISNRVTTFNEDIQKNESTTKLSALFSTGSTEVTQSSLLSSGMVYDSIIINDPLVTSQGSIKMKSLTEGLELFAWAFDLIKAGFIKVFPLTYINRPSNTIPILASDDAFRSCIPAIVHDFIHENSLVRSVIRDDKGQMLVLAEDASVAKRTALDVSFKNDRWRTGVRLYLFQTLENCRRNESGDIVCDQHWDHLGQLDSAKFNAWSYQSVNQAMRTRLNDICNETRLAEQTGHVYITESEFEAKLLSMAGIATKNSTPIATKFLDANNIFVGMSNPKTLLELRTKHHSAFDRFNLSLQEITDELSQVAPDQFDKKAKALFQQQILPQIEEIRAVVKSIYVYGTKGALVTLTGISAAMLSGSVVPLVPALLLSAAGGMSDALTQLSQASMNKRKPAYIWHRIYKG